MQQEVQSILERMKVQPPIKWVFTGDSITHGALHTLGWRDYTEHFSEVVRYEKGRGRDMVIKTAISGWTTQLIRDDLDWNVLQFNPDVVSIMIGMNDAVQGEAGLAKFRDNYCAMLDRIAEQKPAGTILHTPNPIWPTAVERASLPLYAEAIRQLARERTLPLVDHWAHWTKAYAENPQRPHMWMADPIHPGVFGHRAFAHLLLKELGLWADTGYVARLFVP